MCNVEDHTDLYRIVDEVIPTPHLKTEGERFIKFLSDKQLSKTADVYKISQNSLSFREGSSLPRIPESITGLSCLNKFQSECGDDQSINIKDADTHSSNWSEITSKSCSEFINNELRFCEEEAVASKPNSVETKLLAFYMKNHKSTKKEESIAHKNAFNEIIKIHELHSFDTKSQYEAVKALRKQQIDLQKPKKKVLKNYSKSLWDVKRCTKFKEDKQPKEYTCSPDPLLKPPLEIEEGFSGSSSVIFTTAKELTGFSFPRLSDVEIQKIPQFKNYSRGEPSKVLFIKNIHKKTTESQFVALLLGALKECGISDDGVTCKILHGRMRGTALVSFKSSGDASLILECLNGYLLNRRPIVLQFSNKTAVT